eukprot:150289_1
MAFFLEFEQQIKSIKQKSLVNYQQTLANLEEKYNERIKDLLDQKLEIRKQITKQFNNEMNAIDQRVTGHINDIIRMLLNNQNNADTKSDNTKKETHENIDIPILGTISNINNVATDIMHPIQIQSVDNRLNETNTLNMNQNPMPLLTYSDDNENESAQQQLQNSSDATTTSNIMDVNDTNEPTIQLNINNHIDMNTNNSNYNEDFNDEMDDNDAREASLSMLSDQLMYYLFHYMSLRDKCIILRTNRKVNRQLNEFAKTLNYFGYPLDTNNASVSIWFQLNKLLSPSIHDGIEMPILSKHEQTIYCMSYHHPYLISAAWDPSFRIFESVKTGNKLELMSLGECTYGKTRFKFSGNEEFYVVDFRKIIYNDCTKLFIVFGGNINLYLSIFNINTKRFETIQHAYGSVHRKYSYKRTENKHYIRSCKIAPREICDVSQSGYFLVIAGHGDGDEIMGILAINTKCEILYKHIISEECCGQVRSIAFYYDDQNDIKLLFLSTTSYCGTLLIYKIQCLERGVEIKCSLIQRIEDTKSFRGAISIRNNYLVTCDQGSTVNLWKINTENIKKLDVDNQEIPLITKLWSVNVDGYVNQVDFFHKNIFVMSCSSGQIIMIFIEDNKMKKIKTWINELTEQHHPAFWAVVCVENYILTGDCNGTLGRYAIHQP